MPIVIALIAVAVAAVVCFIVGYAAGQSHRKKTAEQAIGSAEKRSRPHNQRRSQGR